ncbi:hypothetical protein Ciccas_014379, partial [Cichlidogyrus casuarinus]
MTQLKLVDLTVYQFYFVRFTVNISSKLRSNETSQSVSSSWIKVGPTAPGGKVTNLRFEQTNAREAKLLWQRPEIQNAPIDGYQVEDMRKQFKFSTKEASIKVNGLEPCSAYTFYVFAFNNGTERGIGGGNGPKNSLEFKLVFMGDFERVDLESLKITPRSSNGRVDFTWLKPTQCSAEYLVYIDDEKMGETEKEFFTVNNLVGNTTHSVYISTKVNGRVKHSKYQYFKVPAYAPGKVRDITCDQVAGGMMVVCQWLEPIQTNGYLNYYLVKVNNGNDTQVKEKRVLLKDMNGKPFQDSREYTIHVRGFTVANGEATTAQFQTKDGQYSQNVLDDLMYDMWMNMNEYKKTEWNFTLNFAKFGRPWSYR